MAFTSMCVCVLKHRSQESFARFFRTNANSARYSLDKGGKRVGLAPFTNSIANSNVGWRSLAKPLVFTISFSGCCFLSASIWQYENMKRTASSYAYRNWFDSSFTSKYKRWEFRRKCAAWWSNKTEGQKVVSVIIGINSFIFLLWRIPSLQPFMIRYFCCSPAMKNTCMPMLLSTFSHYSLLHLTANMFVLYSFSSSAVAFFGKEQFVAFYCSAGVVSSFASYVHKIMFTKTAVSLGASGALMAILSSICTQFPDARLSVIFLPFLTLPAGRAINLLMTFDAIGIIAKWKLLDHASHLGGAIFGIWYLLYGRKCVWDKREPFMLWWHNFKEGK